VDLVATGKEKRQALKERVSEPDFPAHKIHETRVKEGRKKESCGGKRDGERET
jgi:hypothetical protein